jgi:hypothetical protein
MEECHEDNPLQQPSPESPNNVRSCWDADDDEFWPGVYDTSYGTSDPTKLSTAPALPATIKSTRGEWAGIDSLASRISNLQVTDTDDARITFANEEEERRKESNRKLIEELQDPARSKPRDADRHDEFMRIFFRNDYDGLPADTSIRHMHLLDLASYFNSTSPIIEYVLPRLCDAVATVLFETDRKCLDDFLDSEVRIFEWRHTYHASSLSSGRLSVIIRREDYRVVVSIIPLRCQ